MFYNVYDFHHFKIEFYFKMIRFKIRFLCLFLAHFKLFLNNTFKIFFIAFNALNMLKYT